MSDKSELMKEVLESRIMYPRKKSGKIRMPQLTDDLLGLEIEAEKTQEEEVTRNGLIGCWLSDFKESVRDAEWNFMMQQNTSIFNLTPSGSGMPGDGMETEFDAIVCVDALPPNMNKSGHSGSLTYSLCKAFSNIAVELEKLLGHADAFRMESFSFDARAARDVYLRHVNYIKEALQYRPKTAFTEFIVGIEQGGELEKSLTNPTIYQGPIGFRRFEAAKATAPSKVFGHIFVGTSGNIEESNPKELMKEGNLSWIDQVLFNCLFESSYMEAVISAYEGNEKDLPAPDRKYMVPAVLFRAQANSLAMLPYKLTNYVDWVHRADGTEISREDKLRQYAAILAFREIYDAIHSQSYYADVHDPVHKVRVSFTFPYAQKSIISEPTIMNRYCQGQYNSADVHDQSGRSIAWLNMNPEAMGSAGSQFRFCLIAPLQRGSWPAEHQGKMSASKVKNILLEYPGSVPGPMRVDKERPIYVSTELTQVNRDPNVVVDAHFIEGTTVAGEYVYKQPTFLSEFVDTVSIMIPKDLFVPRMPNEIEGKILAMFLGNRSQTAGTNAFILCRASQIPVNQRKNDIKWRWE